MDVKGTTRRDIARALIAIPAAAMAQQPAPDDLLASAREQMKHASQELRNFKVPIATEPSFAFRP
jgi:hypothetical protein